MAIDEAGTLDAVVDAYERGVCHGISLVMMHEMMRHNYYNTGYGKHPISEFDPTLIERMEPKFQHFIKTGEWT
jgi:hypothetical protein